MPRPRCLPWARRFRPAAVPARQLVERRHLATRRSTPSSAALHRVHQQRRHAPPAPGFRRRGVAGQRRDLRHPVRRRRRQQPKVAVTFQYASESDGVNGVPFYPIPAQAHRRRRTGSKAARPATSTSAARAIATCSSSTARTGTSTSSTTCITTRRKAAGSQARAPSSTLTATIAGPTGGPRRTPPVSRSCPASCATTRRSIPRSPTSAMRSA